MTKPGFPSPHEKALKYLGVVGATDPHREDVLRRPFYLLSLGPDAPVDVVAAWRVVKHLNEWRREVAVKYEGLSNPLELSEGEIAGQLGIAGSTLRKVINGERWLRFEAVVALAAVRPQAVLAMF